MSSSDVGHQLRQAGLRVTTVRQSMLQWLAEHPRATTEQVRAGAPTTSTAPLTCVRLTPSDDHSYLLDEAEVVFWGTCPSCQDPAWTTRPMDD
ncbi:MAG: hypothetical protein ACRDRO_01885 [Pseudonocardiaceae bacterium]